jgi:hypothetical protein
MSEKILAAEFASESQPNTKQPGKVESGQEMYQGEYRVAE